MNHSRIFAGKMENLCFVNNNDVSEGNLYKDRLHLLEAVKHMLANSFINGINNNYFLLKHSENNHF